MRCRIGQAARGAQITTGGDKRLGEPGVEGVTTEAERRLRQTLRPHGLIAEKPFHFTMLQGVGEKRLQPKAGDGAGVETGDEFAADPVPWIASGLVQHDGHVLPPQGEAERETGETAADNFDRTQGTHVRRIATMR